MTVVAAFELERWPILLGDILLSGDENGHVIHLPTIGNIDQVFPEGSGFVPTNVKQKLCIIDDNLVIGWAGSALNAYSIIKQIRSDLAGRQVTGPELETFFRQIDPEHHGKVSFVGAHFDGQRSYTFGYNSDDYQSPLFREVRLAGSGSNDLQRCIAQYSQSVGIVDRSPDQHSVDRAVGASIGMASLLLGIEIVTGRNLLKYYGGGFELAARVEGRFVKVGDITYMFSIITEKEDGTFLVSLPVVVNKYDYRGDLLIIRSMHINSSGFNDQLKMHVDRQSTNVIRPIDRSLDQIRAEDIPILDYNSKFACYFYLLIRKDGSSEFLNFTECVPDRNHGISFDEVGKNINLRCVNNYFKWVTDRATENCTSYYESKQS